MAPDPQGEGIIEGQANNAAGDLPNQQLMYEFLGEFMEFAWDPENSSRDVQFSADFRHLFLCESNYYFRTVVGNRPFSDGVHYWEIVADSRTEHELKVGVTTQ